MLKIKTLGPINELSITSTLESTKNRNNFNGLPIVTNYANIAPFCIVEEHEVQDKVHGLFMEALKIATDYLNLTLILQRTKPENQHIWNKK